MGQDLAPKLGLATGVVEMWRRAQSDFTKSRGEGTQVGEWGGAHNTGSGAEDQAVGLDPTVAGEQPAVAEWRSTLTLCRRLRWVQELGGVVGVWSVSGAHRRHRGSGSGGERERRWGRER
jgi:hypothetical protein